MESDSETHSGEDTTPDDWMELADASPDASPAASPANSPAASPAVSTDATQKPSEKEDFKLSLITWNVDGLDFENLPERSKGLVKYLNLYKPDVVFLQELIDPYAHFLKKRLVSYLMIEGAEEGYFTGMLLKKSRVTLVESEIVPYRTTKMMRNLLVAQVIVDGQKLCLMTSHFESGKANSKERMNQLHVVKWRFKRTPDDVTVVFGGDTNLRDAEVRHCSFHSDTACNLVTSNHSNSFLWTRLRYPRWACLQLSVMCGSNWASRSTAATRGTPLLTPTRKLPFLFASALTESTSARPSDVESLVWPLITWPWWGWRSWTVAATLVITGESTAPSQLNRTTQNNQKHDS
ncbi:glucuronosyltransferase [Sarotherodon galilaeus]